MKKKKQSNAPKVALAWRLYEAKKAQILASDATLKEKEQQLRAAAAYCGI